PGACFHHGIAHTPRSPRRRRRLADRRLQRARLAQESDPQCVQADRRPAQAAPRFDPQPRECRDGRDGLREVDPGSGDSGAGPGGARGASSRPLDEAQGVTDEASLNLFQQQEANRRRTFWLMVGFVAFFAWLGFGGDYIYHLYTLDAPRRAYHRDFPWLGIGLSLVALALAW